MTFGNLKSIIEKNLLESYSDEKDFKKSLREFKHNVLNNKSMSRAYALYDQLSTPQGLSEQDAKEFLEEGISLLHKILPTIKSPKSLSETIKNNYSDLDVLSYSNKLNLLLDDFKTNPKRYISFSVFGKKNKGTMSMVPLPDTVNAPYINLKQ